MSIKAINLAMNQEGIGPVDKAVLFCLANYANDDGICFPSITWLEKKSGACRSTVIRSLGSLSRRSIISKVLTDGAIPLKFNRGQNAYKIKGAAVVSHNGGASSGDTPPLVAESYQTSSGELPPDGGGGCQRDTSTSSGETLALVAERHPILKSNESITKDKKEKESKEKEFFDFIYLNYPRKTGKHEAFKQYQKLKLSEQQELTGKIGEIVNFYGCTAEKYIPHLATFISNKRFQDDLSKALNDPDQACRDILDRYNSSANQQQTSLRMF